MALPRSPRPKGKGLCHAPLISKRIRTQHRLHRAHDIPKARAREEILRQNDRIRILEKDARIKTTYLYLALLSIALIVFVGLTIIYYLRQRYRIRDIENKQLRENLRQEALIYSMNRKNFEDDLQQKACEISSNTLLLANKMRCFNKSAI